MTCFFIVLHLCCLLIPAHLCFYVWPMAFGLNVLYSLNLWLNVNFFFFEETYITWEHSHKKILIWHLQLQDNTNICTHKATSVGMPLSWELLEVREH